jgi:hypothetical protein
MAITSVIAETQQRAGEPQPRGFISLGAPEQECKSGAKARGTGGDGLGGVTVIGDTMLLSGGLR